MASEIRPPRFAGVLYPEEPDELRAAMLSAVARAGRPRQRRGSDVIGVLCPYQPLEGRAGALVEATLRGLPPAAEIDLIVLLGTDHHPGLLPFAITDKRYATPLAALPSDPALVAALERRLPWIRREELRHREGMSLELGALALGHIYGDACPPVLPVLCGQTALLTGDDEAKTDAFLATMEHVLEGKRVLWWISAELSHAGPAFGRPPLAAEGVRALGRARPGLPRFPGRRPPRAAGRPLHGERRGPRSAERRRGPVDRRQVAAGRLPGRARRVPDAALARARRGLGRPRRDALLPTRGRRRRLIAAARLTLSSGRPASEPDRELGALLGPVIGNAACGSPALSRRCRRSGR
jgi:AmmeMemoRadiSam system protein B